MKQKELSRWIRGIAVLGAVCVLFFASVVAPGVVRDLIGADAELSYLCLPSLVFFWVTVLPVLGVALLAWQIGGEIGRDNSFSLVNAQRLRTACILAVADTLLYLLAGIVLAVGGLLHPGVLILLIGIESIGLACAVVFAALSHFTRKAAELKDENDFTI